MGREAVRSYCRIYAAKAPVGRRNAALQSSFCPPIATTLSTLAAFARRSQARGLCEALRDQLLSVVGNISLLTMEYSDTYNYVSKRNVK
jgi:hypothetical protein